MKHADSPCRLPTLAAALIAVDDSDVTDFAVGVTCCLILSHVENARHVAMRDNAMNSRDGAMFDK